MKRIILTLSSLFLYSLCSAQSSAREFQNLISVSTTAPDVASIGKFGNIPVSYATGIPSVTIPIFEINVGKIRIPLSLDYHGGGVRVDETASSVATSWAMNGIGMVSRNMIGLPDENTNGGYLSAMSLDTVYNFFNHTVYGAAKDLACAKFIEDVKDNLRETEPDAFSYDIGGSSGKFMYKPNGTIIQIPVTSNKIERNGANFKITDPNGIRYVFDQQESTYMVTQSAVGPGTYTSSWRLSQIIDQNAVDTVYINYQSITSSTLERMHNYTYSLGDQPNVDGSSGVSPLNRESMSIQTITHPTELFPLEIKWRGGKITFKNAQDRTDRPGEIRLDSVKVYSKQNGAYQLVKSVKLYQSYFYSNPIPGATATEKNYRLRLDSVAFIPVTGTGQRQTYKMTYNNNPIAPNESYAQDIWGYYNGKVNNTTLMPSQSVLYNGAYYNIGSANRDTDPQYTNSCMMQSIQYPTKGKSVFEFEPHQYVLNYRSTRLLTNSLDLHDGVHQTLQTSFFVPDTASSFRYSVTISTYSAQQGVTDYPRAVLTDQTTGQEVFRITNTTPTQEVSTGTLATTLVAGHTYILTASTYTLNTSVRVQASVSWLEPNAVHEIRAGGGLRVKTITNYDNNGKFIDRKSYQYGTDGSGELLTPASYLLVNYENVFFEGGVQLNPQNPASCFDLKGDPSVIYHANSIYPATQFGGSPVGYSSVTEFEADSLGNTPNGKTEYDYDVSNDDPGYQLADYGTIGVLLTANSWKNGFLMKQSTYKSKAGAYYPVHIQQNVYSMLRQDTLRGLKIKPLYMFAGGCYYTSDTIKTRYTTIGSPNLDAHYYIYKINTVTGAILLRTQADTTWDDLGRKQVVLHNTYYDDLTHILPTKKETFNSAGDNLTDVIKYPHDLAVTGNVYQKMMDRNIIAPIVRFQQLKNGSQLALANINYNDWFGDSKLLLPQTVDEQVLANPIVTRTRFNGYDANGNILQQQKVNGPYQSYQWGYNKQYPVAVVANAASNEFYAENFEESTAANVTAGTGHTGTRFYSGSYTVNWTRPNSRSYVISYWYLSNGSWLLQNAVPYTGSSYTLTGGTAYDDIRIYPVDSQMSTYTYLPLIGMTSATDAKNQTTYYEYDELQRLRNVKDKDGNIVKHAEYHYKAQ